MLNLMTIADLFLTEDKVYVVTLDAKAGFILRCPRPASTEILVQVPGEEDIRTIPVRRIAMTDCPPILCETNEWGGSGGWTAYRNKYLKATR